ncbi:MAG: hypothetical protein CMA65_04485 [Euryarchaeota archaeon]|nr:hypothetical protein [Euryarchaeota archaeon]
MLQFSEIDARVRDLNFDRIVWKIIHDPFKPDMTEEDVLLAVKKYKRFLNLKVKFPKMSLVPTDDIDMIWHSHILDTEQYAKDCNSLFGEFLHHEPFFGNFGNKTQQGMGVMFKQTSDVWFQEYGEVLNTPLYFRCEGKKCHVPSNCRCR